MSKSLLEVDHLSISFWGKDRWLKAVKDISFTVNQGEIVAIVGESGSGKSVTAEALLGLHQPATSLIDGRIRFNGELVYDSKASHLASLRGKAIGMIFQDALNSLNPVFKIDKQFIETLRQHQKISKKAAKALAVEALQLCGISDPVRILNSYPHELSGGLQQRVMIALAISCQPKLLIGDEPTTALDVTIQYQILTLLKDIQAKLNTGILLITHDFGVVAEIATRVIVMYAGEIVESGPTADILNSPRHPYTQSLLKSRVPKDIQATNGKLTTIQGSVPSLQAMPEDGCRFAPRIPWLPATAHETSPQLHQVGGEHWVRCRCWEHFKFAEELSL